MIKISERDKPIGKYDNKTIYFVRYGNLNSVKQEGYITDENKMSFHTPPTRNGFYAFVWPYIESFLLSGRKFEIDKAKKETNETNELRDRYQYKKDPKGNRIVSDWILDRYKIKYPNQERTLDEFIKEFKKEQQNEMDQSIEESQNKKQELGFEKWLEKGYNITQPRNVTHEIEVKKPKIFTYTGELWHHLGALIKPGFILRENGSWVLTSFETFKKAFLYEKLNVKKNNYSRDHLEVFIERLK